MMGESKSLNNTISATSALARNILAPSPSFTVLGGTGAGKSTFVYSLLNEELSKHLKTGIGEVSHSTLVPCTFCFDERISDPNEIALHIDRKFFPSGADASLNEYVIKTIFSVIQPILLGKFILKDFKSAETLDSITDDDIMNILEPDSGEYHLAFLPSDKDFYNEYAAFSNGFDSATTCSSPADYSPFKAVLKDALLPILKYMEPIFKLELAERRKDPKFHRTEMAQLRELVFVSLLDNVPKEDLRCCRSLFRAIIKAIENKLENTLGKDYYNTLYASQSIRSVENESNTIPLSLSSENDCRILSDLVNPNMPFNLIVDHIYIACQPNRELKKCYAKAWESSDISELKPTYPLRFSITDTSFITQTETSIPSMKESIESAITQNTDCIFYLFSLENRRKALLDNVKALKAIASEIFKKNREIPLHVIFTKADRILESITFRNDNSSFKLKLKSFKAHLQESYNELDERINGLLADAGINDDGDMANALTADWLSLGCLEDYPAVNLPHFGTDYLFDKVGSAFLNIIREIIDKKDRHLYFILKPIDVSKPSISVKIGENGRDKLKEGIANMQRILTTEKDIVNGYRIISDKPLFHAASVRTYFEKLRLGLGHSTKSSTYDNFSINMKGLLRRVILQVFPDFGSLNEGNALDFDIENISPEDRRKLDCFIYNTKKPVSDNVIKEHLSDAFLEVFKDDKDNNVYKYAVNRIAYGLSFGNHNIGNRIALAYYTSSGYNNAMKNMQEEYFKFFSPCPPEKDADNLLDFPEVFIQELEKTLTEMINFAFVIC